MRLVACSVFDSKVGAFAAPFFCRTRGEGIRSFESAVRDQAMPFSKHPADYMLYVVGEWDDNDGCLSGFKPERLIGADEFVVSAG